MNLVEWLRAKQASLGLSDRAFAREIGIPQQSWHRYTHGEINPGRKLIAAALRAFPTEEDQIARCVLVSTMVDSRSPIEVGA